MRHLRWWIIGVCFLGSAINYIDRQCLSVAAPTLCKEFGFSSTDYSTIVNSFVAAYTTMQFVSGWIVDRIGTRRGMALFVLWWSLAAMLHSLGRGLWSFRAVRFLLGMGEAGNWPASTRAVSEWFPPRERGLAVAIFDSGSCIGGVIAVPLVAWLINGYGWRFAFLATGALAMFWLILWLWIYYPPRQHPRVTAAELGLIPVEQQDNAEKEGPRLTWHWVLASPQAWGIFLGRFLTDCIWWFYVYWLPKYLADQCGFSLSDIAISAWIPFVAADIGNLGGGWFSGRLIRRGWSINAARKTVMVLGVLGMLAGVPAGLVAHAGLSLVLIALVTLSYSAWGTMMLTLPTDLFPSRQTASASGFSGMGAGLGGIIFTWLIGSIVDRFNSYIPIFLMTGVMPIMALAIVQLLIPNIPVTTSIVGRSHNVR